MTTPNIHTTTVEERGVPVYLAEPADATPDRAVIVIQEAFGVNDHIEDVTRRFAALGWLAAAPHLYHRDGSPTFAYDDLAGARPHMAALTDDAVDADLTATLDLLAARGVPAGRVAIVGFCMGGRVAFLGALRHDLGTVVSFYGGGIAAPHPVGWSALGEHSDQLRAPVLAIFGDADHTISVDDVEAWRERLANVPTEVEIVRYPEAGHGFHCDARAAYHETSAKDAWARTLKWLDRHIPAAS